MSIFGVAGVERPMPIVLAPHHAPAFGKLQAEPGRARLDAPALWRRASPL